MVGGSGEKEGVFAWRLVAYVDVKKARPRHLREEGGSRE